MRKAFVGFVVSCGIFLLALLGAVQARGRELPRLPETRPVKVAILVFDGVQIIDFSGPWEVFGEAGYQVFTVAEAPAPVTAAFGEKVVPAFTFENAPKADVLVVPGGLVDDRLLSDQRLVQWIRQTAGSSEKVLSVCTGAFLLAQAGLLDGLKATTYHGAIGELAAMAPKARVVDDERFADNGKIVVAAGLSSGIDGALHVVEGIDGLGTAEATALNMEYDWNRKGTYVRASLPDKYIRFIRDAMPGAYVERDGDRSRWRDSWLVAGMASRDDAMVLVNRVASGGKGWRRLDASESKEGAPSHWAFEDDQGRKWSAVASVEPLEGSATQMIVSLEIGELSKGQ